MIKMFFQWIVGFLRKPEVKEIPEVKIEPKKKQRKKYTSHKEERETFVELLDTIEDTFENYKLPTMSASWVSRDSIIGLKKLGSHVPNPFLLSWDYEEKKIKLDGIEKLPALMCISIKKMEIEGKVCPSFMFAIKHKKLPWYVAYNPGIPYEFGMAYPIEGKTFWTRVFLTVNRHTGSITSCDERIVKKSVIPTKTLRGKHSHGQTAVVSNIQFSSPSFFEDEGKSIEERRIMTKNMFRQMFEWWIKRDERWNVVVKKNGERLTFGVPNDQTKNYFKDRDRVITESGNSKKIIHYVKEHERVYGDKTTTVKEHMRGLKEFSWKGYQIQVVSPKFEQKTSAIFTAPAQEIEEQATNVIYLSKLGKLLADMEDRKTA